MFTPNQLELIGSNDFDQVVALDQQLDKQFGLDIAKVEDSISNLNPQFYQGLSAEALNTSYLDYYQLLQFIPKGSIFVDVGSGYSRGSFIAQKLERDYVGLEYIQERVEVANKNLTHNMVRQCDVIKEELPIGDYYFLYLPHGPVLYQSLKKIQQIARTRQVRLLVIESHGDVVEYLKQQSWLKPIETGMKTSLPRHNRKIYCFACHSSSRQSLFEQHWDWNLNTDTEYVINDEGTCWTSDTFGSEILYENQLQMQLMNPYRMFSVNSICEVRQVSKQCESYQQLHRAKVEKYQTIKGHITKIITKPAQKVEWLNGELTDWQQALELLVPKGY
jgi:SAM-dependent methyltransferase